MTEYTDDDINMMLVDSEVVKRRKAIGDLLMVNPDMHSAVIAARLGMNKVLVKPDIEALTKEGHSGALKRQENNFYRVQRKNEIEKTLKEHPFTDQIALAKHMEMKLSDFRAEVDEIKKESENLEKENKEIVERRHAIKTLMQDNPDLSLAEAAISLNVTLDQIILDQEHFDDPRYIDLQRKVKIESMLASIARDIKECQRQFELCVDIDPRAGTRWKEEGRKYKALYADLAMLLPKQGINVNLSINRTQNERDAIRKAARLTAE